MIQRYLMTALLPLLIVSASQAEEDSIRVPDLEGHLQTPLESGDAKAVVLLFMATDCPISNRYAPVVNRIYDAYKNKGIRFFAVYPMESDSGKTINPHRKDFGYSIPALIDHDHLLVDSARASVTPEAAVYAPAKTGGGTWIYVGRIDDLYVDFGKWRRSPSTNDLTELLDKLIAGETIKPQRTRAVGCYIRN